MFWRQKIKSCKSSETHFAKVSRRSEPCSRGKRPFEVSKKNRIRGGWPKNNRFREFRKFFETLNGRLLLNHGSDRPQTLAKRVSDDLQHFIFRRRKVFFRDFVLVFSTFLPRF